MGDRPKDKLVRHEMIDSLDPGEMELWFRRRLSQPPAEERDLGPCRRNR